MELQIETDRLRLSPPVREDVARITELLAEKDVSWMLGRVPYPYSTDDAETWVAKVAEDIEAGTEYAFAIRLPGEGMIGACGLTKHGPYWEVGYWLGKPYWEQGFATEAARAVLDWARTHIPADQFISGHIVDNASSGRVLRKLGFEAVGEITMYVTARDTDIRAVRFVHNAPAEAALAPDRH